MAWWRMLVLIVFLNLNHMAYYKNFLMCISLIFLLGDCMALQGVWRSNYTRLGSNDPLGVAFFRQSMLPRPEHLSVSRWVIPELSQSKDHWLSQAIGCKGCIRRYARTVTNTNTSTTWTMVEVVVMVCGHLELAKADANPLLARLGRRERICAPEISRKEKETKDWQAPFLSDAKRQVEKLVPLFVKKHVAGDFIRKTYPTNLTLE